MSIKGKEIALRIAIERARRTHDTICIVQIGDNEYVLWREINLSALQFQYQYYRVIKKVRIRLDDFR